MSGGVDERARQARLLYERAVYAGDAGPLADADRQRTRWKPTSAQRLEDAPVVPGEQDRGRGDRDGADVQGGGG